LWTRRFVGLRPPARRVCRREVYLRPQVRALISKAYERALNLIAEKRDVLTALAERLLKVPTLVRRHPSL
jgi:hypothetical protein